LREFVWIGLALLFSVVTYCTIGGVYAEPPLEAGPLGIPDGATEFQTSYTNRGPIFILSDSDFSSYGFPGTGDQNSPYRIEGYSITDSNFELIVIENTEAYFVIQNNYLNSITSSLDAIYMRNAKNGRVYNNILVSNRHGIFIDAGCQSMNVTSNLVWDSSQSGIRINSSSDVRVHHNEVYLNTYNGIWANCSTNLDIWNNTVYDDELGIWLRNCNGSQILDNTLYGNDNALWLSNSSNSNNILFNRIFDPAEANPNTCGIHLSHDAHGNNILNNTVSNSTEHGIYIEDTSGNNMIKWNTFIGNNLGGASQAFDAASVEVLYNYWSDWTTPDDDSNQIVDTPYSLEGPVMNEDPFPLTQPANPPEFHYLTPMTVLHPNGGESVPDSLTIQWTTCYDSEDHAVNYSIYFTHNSGADWEKLAGNLTANQYEWDTTTELKTTHYLIRVVAECSDGLTVSDESDGEFSLIAHTLSDPIITSPTTSGPFDTSLMIGWNDAVDSWDYTVSYSIQYSSDGGSSWSDLTSGLTGNSYQWDISELEDGEDYVVKLIASTDGGQTSEAISLTFSIEHDTTTTTGGDGDMTLVLVAAGVGAAAVVVVLVIVIRMRGTVET
jgi:parallel beta-helix repeat protein